jgi:hypothetical protein
MFEAKHDSIGSNLWRSRPEKVKKSLLLRWLGSLDTPLLREYSRRTLRRRCPLRSHRTALERSSALPKLIDFLSMEGTAHESQQQFATLFLALVWPSSVIRRGRSIKAWLC